MTFKHKLAKRLAINGTRWARLGWAASPESPPITDTGRSCTRSTRWCPRTSLTQLLMTTAALFGAACAGENATNPDPDFAEIRIWPRNWSVEPGGRAHFQAFGLLSAGDSIPAIVNWSATGGAISPTGEFTAASDTGTYRVVAVHHQRLWLGDSTSGTIVLPEPSLIALNVEPRDPTVELSDSIDLRAIGLLSTGDTQTVDVVWTAEAGSITSKGNGRGWYKPERPGRFRVMATADTLSDSTTVTVPDKTAAVASVDVTPSSVSAPVGQTTPLLATPRDQEGNPLTDREVSWASGNPSVATVSGTGVVTAVGAGDATITATSEGRSGTSAVTVTAAAVAVASVDVTPATATLEVGQTRQLAATPRDAQGNALAGRSVTWTTGNSTVATVSASGLVTGRAAGTATITATSEGRSGTATITVSLIPVATVQVAPATATVYVNQTVTLTATPRDAQGNPLTGRSVSWTTSSGAVATVSSAGVVIGVAPGSATITATSEGRSGGASITVSLAPVASVQVSPASISVPVGQTRQLSVTLRDALGNTLTGRPVSWTSSNPGVATVLVTGLVTGVAAGSATIAATSEGRTGTASVTVSSSPPSAVAEPSFGDDPADRLIWQEDFESVSALAELATVNGGSWALPGAESQPVLDATRGRNASRALLFPKLAGTSGHRIERTVSSSPAHFFATHWFKLVAGNGDVNMKFLIIHHDAEGGSIQRYQFAHTNTTEFVGQPNTPPGRFSNRAVIENEAGPQGGEGIGYFRVPGQPNWNPNEKIPTKADDPDIGLTPWGPINDGQWHRQTIEIKTGPPGVAYMRLWLDGYLYWDSQGSTMGLPGRPTAWKYETVSGTPSIGFNLWFDDLTIWRR